MRPCNDILMSPSGTIEDAIRVIDESGFQIALVVDTGVHLLGTITDGDVRRAILKGTDLLEPAEKIMNPRPTTVSDGTPPQAVFALMSQRRLRGIPVINDEMQVVGIELLEDFMNKTKRDNAVVLMAGGLGTRLAPLTADCPKSLLPIGPKPILETILASLIDYSFYNFYLSVNYKAEMIEKHFGKGDKWGANIQYLRENKRLGTAGALSLLPSSLRHPVIVINGDLLTRVDFSQLLQFHSESQSVATVCVSEKGYAIPYGVVKFNGHHLMEIEEKPELRMFVNAGIYVIEPSVLSLIPKNTYTDMTTLLDELLHLNHKISVFPIREYWLDIGKMDDYNRAIRDYPEVFP